jgi:hypothetical protein
MGRGNGDFDVASGSPLHFNIHLTTMRKGNEPYTHDLGMGFVIRDKIPDFITAIS